MLLTLNEHGTVVAVGVGTSINVRGSVHVGDRMRQVDGKWVMVHQKGSIKPKRLLSCLSATELYELLDSDDPVLRKTLEKLQYLTVFDLGITHNEAKAVLHDLQGHSAITASREQEIIQELE